MRKLLATAVAIAPLMAAGGAHAEVVISTTRTTPISTSNATGSGPDTIRFATGGMISLTNGAGVTIDSSHNVTISSGASVSIVNGGPGSAGVLIHGGNTASLSIAGGISVTDDIDAYKDTDEDGDIDGPWATGSDRYGVRLVGPGALTGDVRMELNSTMLVEGNNSYGISLESHLIGNLINLGSLRVVGDNSIGIRATDLIEGSVYIGGKIDVSGDGVSAVSFTGDINGRLSIQGELTASGYRYTSRGSDDFISKLDPDDLLQYSGTVIIAGNVSGGVVFDTPPTDTDPNNNDEDGDGVMDVQETTPRIFGFGAAPAVTVGSDTQDITLGFTGTGDNAYGFINRGEISGQGVYDNISATAVRFGLGGGQTVTIQGGVRNEGAVTALSYEADATAFRFSSGATTPEFINANVVTAASASETAVRVTGLLIEAGANLPKFTNTGLFLTASGGGAADVTAIRDLSGTLTTIINQKSLQANLSPNDDNDPLTGRTVAIDVTANTTGVTFIQEGIASTPTTEDPDTDGDGVTDSNEPILTGDILFGSGADVMDVRNGLVQSNISFGDGADTLLISGDSIVRGAITDSDGQLDISILNGVLDARQTSMTAVTSLNVAADGVLISTLDPQSGHVAGFDVSGATTIADGAALGVRLNTLLTGGPERFTLVRSGSLSFGAIDLDKVLLNSTYMFVIGIDADVPAGEIYADVRRRTADEIGMIRTEADAYDAIYDVLNRDDTLRAVYLSQTDREGFIDLYEQMLPDHSGGPLLSLASGVDAVTRALTGRNASAAPGETSAWLQEINFYADKDKTDSYGFRSEGFGVAGGIERGTDNGAFGISVAFTSSDLEDPEAEAEEVLSANLLELGVYWRAQGQYWTTWARAAAGYASFESRRALVGSGLNLRNESSWNGYTLAAAGGFSYERSYGRYTIRPEVYAEYFSLSEGSHKETGGGDGFDLEIDSRDGHMFSAVAAMNISMGMGENSWLRPELRIGWRQNLSVDAGKTTARFVSGGPDFTLSPGTIEGGGLILGFRLNVGNELGMLSVTADAELLEDYVRYMLMLRASFRF